MCPGFEVGPPATKTMFCVNNFIRPLNSVLIWVHLHLRGNAFRNIIMKNGAGSHFEVSLRSAVLFPRRTFLRSVPPLNFVCMHAVAVAPQPLFLLRNEKLSSKKLPQILSLLVLFAWRVGRGRRFEKSRRFLVDILTLVAVALGHFFGFKRDLRASGLVLFWWTCW